MPAKSIERFNTPPGMGHVQSILKRMGALAKEGAHEWPIRQLAVAITRDIPSKSPTREIFAIYKWVRDHIRYRMDPLGLELVQAPRITLEERAGDCDDMTTLIWALSMALGHPVRGRTVGPTPTDQTHVQGEVFDRKRWVSVDPVLEPPQATTAPRTDVGMFAMYAGGAAHRWDLEGRMLSGRARKTVHVDAHTRAWPRPLSGLGAPADAVDRSLWQWCAYYPPWGAAFESSGGQPPQPGVWVPPDSRYRGAGAPGYHQGVMPTPVFYAFHRHQMPTDAHLSGWYGPVNHPQLGAGWLKRKLRSAGKGLKTAVTSTTNAAHQITHGKKSPIRMAHDAVTGIAKKIPVLKPFVELQEKVFGTGTQALLHKAGLINAPGAKMPTLKTLKTSLPAAAAAASSSSGGRAAVSPLAARAAAQLPTRALKAKPPAKHAAKAIPKKATKPKTTQTVTPMKDAWKVPHPELRRKYPPSARMLFDPGSKRFRVFIPKPAAVHGFGAVRPTLTFSIGAAPSTSAQVNATKVAADKMAKAIEAFIAKNKRAPAVSLPAVLAFQKSEGTLKQDGLYGDNSKAAAEYYLGRSLPMYAPSMKSKNGLTWKPPAKVVTTPQGGTVVVQPKPPAPPAPKPVAVPTPEGTKVVTPVQTDVVPVPSGYTEVGREANNPGLPPVGAPSSTTTPATKPLPPGPVQRPDDGVPAPAWTGLPPEEIAILKAHAYQPSPDATYTVVPQWQPGDPLPSQQFPSWQPAGPSAADNALPSDNTPLPGPVYPHEVDPAYGTSYGPMVRDEERDNTWLWVALGYFVLRDRKRAA